MYRILILDAAERDVEHLDKPVARRIMQRIHWLADNLDRISPEPLAGGWASYFKSAWAITGLSIRFGTRRGCS